MAAGILEAFPEHARAVAEWLDDVSAVSIEVCRERRQLVVTLHLPAVVDEDQAEVLMIRAGCAVRRFDPDVTGVDVRVTT